MQPGLHYRAPPRSCFYRYNEGAITLQYMPDSRKVTQVIHQGTYHIKEMNFVSIAEKIVDFLVKNARIGFAFKLEQYTYFKNDSSFMKSCGINIKTDITHCTGLYAAKMFYSQRGELLVVVMVRQGADFLQILPRDKHTCLLLTVRLRLRPFGTCTLESSVMHGAHKNTRDKRRGYFF
jgi:hypothetical protein